VTVTIAMVSMATFILKQMYNVWLWKRVGGLLVA